MPGPRRPHAGNDRAAIARAARRPGFLRAGDLCNRKRYTRNTRSGAPSRKSWIAGETLRPGGAAERDSFRVESFWSKCLKGLNLEGRSADLE